MYIITSVTKRRPTSPVVDSEPDSDSSYQNTFSSGNGFRPYVTGIGKYA